MCILHRHSSSKCLTYLFCLKRTWSGLGSTTDIATAFVFLNSIEKNAISEVCTGHFMLQLFVD